MTIATLQVLSAQCKRLLRVAACHAAGLLMLLGCIQHA